LAGRITALADVYDALTSKRVYKPAFSHEEARRLILEGRGTQFDPAIVDAFETLEDDFVLVRNRFDNASSPFDGVRIAEPQAAVASPS
jgi:HD-GYP domain-containing protein (c-di-GMP phosphodiesterase class II)